MFLRSILLVVLISTDIFAQYSESFEDIIKNPEYATSISISSEKEMKIFDKNIKKFKNLTSLSINGYDEIKSIPKSIYTLKGLQSLSISTFTITQLPPDLGKLVNLEYLNISGEPCGGSTSISKIPNEIGKLKNLREFRASTSNLSFLPASISECENLQVLD